MSKWIVVLLAMGLAGCALFDDSGKDKGDGGAERRAPREGDQVGGPVSPEDRQFVRDALSQGLLKVHASQLAADAQVDAAHRQFAQMAVREYAKLNDALAGHGGRRSMNVPAEMQPRDQQQVERVRSSAGGPAASRTYHDTMLTSLDASIKLFEAASQRTTDMTLKQLAQNAAGMMREHRRMLETIKSTPAGPIRH